MKEELILYELVRLLKVKGGSRIRTILTMEDLKANEQAFGVDALLEPAASISKWISDGNIQCKVVFSPGRRANVNLADDPTVAAGERRNTKRECQVRSKDEE